MAKKFALILLPVIKVTLDHLLIVVHLLFHIALIYLLPLFPHGSARKVVPVGFQRLGPPKVAQLTAVIFGLFDHPRIVVVFYLLQQLTLVLFVLSLFELSPCLLQLIVVFHVLIHLSSPENVSFVGVKKVIVVLSGLGLKCVSHVGSLTSLDNPVEIKLRLEVHES